MHLAGGHTPVAPQPPSFPDFPVPEVPFSENSVGTGRTPFFGPFSSAPAIRSVENLSLVAPTVARAFLVPKTSSAIRSPQALPPLFAHACRLVFLPTKVVLKGVDYSLELSLSVQLIYSPLRIVIQGLTPVTATRFQVEEDFPSAPTCAPPFPPCSLFRPPLNYPPGPPHHFPPSSLVLVSFNSIPSQVTLPPNSPLMFSRCFMESRLFTSRGAVLESPSMDDRFFFLSAPPPPIPPPMSPFLPN